MATSARLTTLACRVRNMEAMVRFYTEAFGAAFQEVDTHGLRCQFGQAGPLTFKFVPIRDAVDFEGFPIHQPGFEVPDVRAVVALATRHGGRLEGTVNEQDGRLHAAIRDPDGNTVELYSAT